jgi:hypothetical protein
VAAAVSPRNFRERNKVHYRLAHWPIWIFVFFLAPGPLIFDLFERGFDRRTLLWLAAVLLATGIAGVRGRLPGVEPRPYILRFTEDKPNPLYRRVCYTVAWGDLLSFAILNLAGLSYAVFTGSWRLRQIYGSAYFPLAIAIWILGAMGKLPRVGSSTKGEENGAPLLLRHRLGRMRRRTRARCPMENATAFAHGGHGKTHRFCRYSGRHGSARAAGRSAANTRHQARRMGRFGLKSIMHQNLCRCHSQ